MIVQPDLSNRLDSIIDRLLVQQRQGMVRVVITGTDPRVLPETLAALEALSQAGYGLRVTLSHSASLSAVYGAFQCWRERFAPELLYDTRMPQAEEEYSELFLPAISGNSLAKIALCLSDNVASAWAFHALCHGRKIIVTLGDEFTHAALPEAMREQLHRYIATLKSWGIVFPGVTTQSKGKQLISLADIRQQPAGTALQPGRNALITPAAQDEIRRRHIILYKD